MKIGIAAVGLFLMTLSGAGQQSAPGSAASLPPAQANASPEPQSPVVITLQGALQRARKLDPTYRSALTDAKLRMKIMCRRASLLPSVSENTESSTLPWASVERTTSRSLLIDSLIRP